jgi:hypothetical protein
MKARLDFVCGNWSSSEELVAIHTEMTCTLVKCRWHPTISIKRRIFPPSYCGSVKIDA